MYIVKCGEYDGKAGLRIRSTAEGEASPPEKDSRSGETGRRSNPTNDTPEPALRTLSTGVEATPRRMRGSSQERE